MFTTTHTKLNGIGLNMRTTLSFIHFMYLTNNDFPIKIEASDRRTFASENTKDVPGKAYFERLGGVAMKNKRALRMLYDHCLSINLSGFDWKMTGPKRNT
jgi:hypothetical protein